MSRNNEGYYDYMLRRTIEENDESSLSERDLVTLNIFDGQEYVPSGTITFGEETFDLGNNVADAINPIHYKEIVPGYEAIDITEALTKDFNGFEGYLAGQVYKYMFRLGKKDAKIQDAKKAQWYLNRLVAEYENE